MMAIKDKVKWSPEKEIEMGLLCRRQEGYPMYIASYADMPLRVNGKPSFFTKCFGGRGPEMKITFTDVPESEIADIRENIRDWERRLKRFGTPEQIAEDKKYGIYLAGHRIPRILIKV